MTQGPEHTDPEHTGDVAPDLEGEVSQEETPAAPAPEEPSAEQQLADWQRVFGDGLHLELTRTGRDGEEAFNQFALQAAGQRGLPVIASNDVRFLSPDEVGALAAFLCSDAAPSINAEALTISMGSQW